MNLCLFMVYRLRKHDRREGGTSVREGGGTGVLWNANFWARHGLCIHELTASVVTCTRPKQDQAMGGHRALDLPLPEMLLAVDIHVLGEIYSSPGVWTPVCCPFFSGWPYTHAHMGITNWIYELLKKKRTWIWKWVCLEKPRKSLWEELGSRYDPV